jgi:uncharacterized membrane protein
MHGHGHGHGHGPAAPAGHRVRVLLAVLLIPCALASVLGVLVLYPFGADHRLSADRLGQRVNAQIAAATAADCSQGSSQHTSDLGQQRCVALSLMLSGGPAPGKGIVSVVPVEPSTPRFAVGDRVVLGYNGGDPTDTASYSLDDFQRGGSLWVLGLLFAAAVIALGRWRGLAALVALGVSFVVLIGFVLPAILDGRNPLAVAVVGSCLIMFAVLYMSHGLSARTSTAVVGTLVSLGLIAVLGEVFATASRLTGLDDETQSLVGSLGSASPLDPRGLLLAGFVIGALGVLDDVTVTQTSAVWELRRANPELTAGGLFTAAMRIGRDHMSSAVNTLVLAYAGASLPLLLLFVITRRDIADSLTDQSVATEVVRTLVGSIGLIASVPITTGVAALVASQEDVR